MKLKYDDGSALVDGAPFLLRGMQVADTRAKRESVFRLRYEVYVEGDGKRIVGADHSARCIEEPLDAWGTLIYQEREGGTVATVRTNFASDGSLAELVPTQLELTRFESFPNGVLSYCSRLAVQRRWRSPRTLLPLLGSVYALGRMRGAHFNVIFCSEEMTRFFRRLGYLRFGPYFEYQNLGLRAPMVLALEDIEHLERCGSPFLNEARKWPRSSLAREWINDILCASESAPACARAC